MIDTDKYEGHTPIEFWEVVGQGEPEETTDSFLATSMWHIAYWMSFNKAMQGNSKADRKLIQDAPLLLAEVKRLQSIISVFDEYMMNDFMTDFSRSEAHAIWSELVRGDGI